MPARGGLSQAIFRVKHQVMSPETPFLDAIRAEPTNVACRLVYADWLEERGDARAELIRIEEEMRPLPVFSDRFWQLKPRRYELLQKLPMDWLETMHYGIDCCPPTFRHQPVTLKDWWRLIRVFTERWHPFPSLPDVGGRPAEIQAAEASLQRELPLSVREWVAFAHDVRTSEDHPILRSDCFLHLFGIQELSALALLRRSYGIHEDGETVWAVQYQDLGNPDPPVWRYERKAGAKLYYSNRNPVARTLSSFALGHSLTRARGMLDRFLLYILYDNDPIYRDEALQSIPVHFSLEVECYDHGEGVDVFEKDNLLVLQEHKGEASFVTIHFGVSKPVPAESMPAFLAYQAANAGMLVGIAPKVDFASLKADYGLGQ